MASSPLRRTGLPAVLFLLLFSLLASTPAFATQTDGLLATVKEGVPSESAIRELEVLGMEAHEAGGLLYVQPPRGMSLEDAMDRVAAVALVDDVQPNFVYELPDSEITATGNPDVSPLSRDYTSGLLKDPLAQNDAYGYWLYNTRAYHAFDRVVLSRLPQVSVAVLDSPVDLQHEDLRSSIRADLARNVTRNPETGESNEGLVDVADYPTVQFHGTHVTGLVAASANNGVGTTGASYNASVVPVVVTDQAGASSTGYLVSGVNYVLDLVRSGRVPNLKVINISLGGYRYDGLAKNDTLLEEAIQEARSLGILTVAGGGNGDGKTIDAPFYPSDFSNTLSVTALQRNGLDVAWSDYNANKDISAPGVNIWSAIPTNSYGSTSGTSMASPIVAGIASFVYASTPGATADDVELALLNSAKPIVGQDAGRAVSSGSKGAVDAEDAATHAYAYLYPRYSDVAPRSWYAGYVGLITDIRHRYMNGYDDDHFGPEDTMSRAQAAQALYNAAGVGTTASSTTFNDVPRGHWATSAIAWASGNGIVTGYDSNTFDPNGQVTREQWATMLSRYAAMQGVGGSVSTNRLDGFSDAWRVSSWARSHLAWAVNLKVIQGVNGAFVAPQDSLTRAQAGTMLVRLNA